jgi:hypothetical protein
MACVDCVRALIIVDQFLTFRHVRNCQNGEPIALPIIYACGLLYGIWWLMESFAWWKLIILFVPLTFFVQGAV